MGLWGAYYSKGMHADALAEAGKFFGVLGDHELEDALRRGVLKLIFGNLSMSTYLKSSPVMRSPHKAVICPTPCLECSASSHCFSELTAERYLPGAGRYLKGLRGSNLALLIRLVIARGSQSATAKTERTIRRCGLGEEQTRFMREWIERRISVTDVVSGGQLKLLPEGPAESDGNATDDLAEISREGARSARHVWCEIPEQC